MTDNIYTFTSGDTPVLVSMPHSGTQLPDAIARQLTERARLLPDTDWHIPTLYDFVFAQNHSVLQANYSRYVIDLNRPPDNESLYPGQATTGLCPHIFFDGEPLYSDDYQPDAQEVQQRKTIYWEPYHQQLKKALEDIKQRHGYAILYDAHSIASHVPRLFEGRLPDLNLGTADGTSCDLSLQTSVTEAMQSGEFSSVVNGRFRGGYITRHYGNPENNIHALQMELAQCNYMSEDGNFAYHAEQAAKLKHVLKNIFQALKI